MFHHPSSNWPLRDLGGWGTGLGPRQWMGNGFFPHAPWSKILRQTSIVWDLNYQDKTHKKQEDISINRRSHKNSEYLDRWIRLKFRKGKLQHVWNFGSVLISWYPDALRHEVEAVLQKLLSSPEVRWISSRALQSPVLLSDQFIFFIFFNIFLSRSVKHHSIPVTDSDSLDMSWQLIELGIDRHRPTELRPTIISFSAKYIGISAL